MRISDWSSDVCSSDLPSTRFQLIPLPVPGRISRTPSRRLPLRPLLGIGGRGLADPGVCFPGVAARLHTLLGDRALALHHGVEFLPVDLAEIVAALRLVPLEVRVRHLEAEDRKSTRLNSSHYCASRMPSSA